MVAPLELKPNSWRKSYMGSTQEFCVLFGTNPGSSTPQNCCCTAINFPSSIHSKKKSKTRLVKQRRAHKLRSPTDKHTSVGRSVKTYFNQLYADTRCRQYDLPIGTDSERESRKSMQFALMMMMMMMMMMIRSIGCVCGFMLIHAENWFGNACSMSYSGRLHSFRTNTFRESKNLPLLLHAIKKSIKAVYSS